MVNSGFNGYFGQLGETLAGTQVTDGRGKPVPVDDGFALIDGLLAPHVPGVFQNGGSPRGKVLLVGNGGSAAIASHVHNDLCKGLGVRALVFNEAPLLTALSNDIEYAAAFEHGADLWLEPSDLVFAISSSGRSENILRAARAAQVKHAKVITLSGFDAGNPLRGLGDLNFYVPSRHYGHVEITHLALLHWMTDSMLVKLGSTAPSRTSLRSNNDGAQVG